MSSIKNTNNRVSFCFDEGTEKLCIDSDSNGINIKPNNEQNKSLSLNNDGSVIAYNNIRTEQDGDIEATSVKKGSVIDGRFDSLNIYLTDLSGRVDSSYNIVNNYITDLSGRVDSSYNIVNKYITDLSSRVDSSYNTAYVLSHQTHMTVKDLSGHVNPYITDLSDRVDLSYNIVNNYITALSGRVDSSYNRVDSSYNIANAYITDLSDRVDLSYNIVNAYITDLSDRVDSGSSTSSGTVDTPLYVYMSKADSTIGAGDTEIKNDFSSRTIHANIPLGIPTVADTWKSQNIYSNNTQFAPSLFVMADGSMNHVINEWKDTADDANVAFTNILFTKDSVAGLRNVSSVNKKGHGKKDDDIYKYTIDASGRVSRVNEPPIEINRYEQPLLLPEEPHGDPDRKYWAGTAALGQSLDKKDTYVQVQLANLNISGPNKSFMFYIKQEDLLRFAMIFNPARAAAEAVIKQTQATDDSINHANTKIEGVITKINNEP